MADQDQAPQNAIPPKAVPPTVPRPTGDTAPLPAAVAADASTVRAQAAVPPGGATPSTGPRTVRLRPIPTAGAAPAFPSSGDAAKKATSRIPMAGIAAASSSAVPGLRRTTPIPPGAGEGDGTVKKMTSRIPMSGSTSTIPAVADAPKTIKIRPLSGTQPVVPGTQPASAAEAGSAGQPQAAKSKTSRIPLDAAMGIPQTPESTTPKTIKLKRPGEMSTVKVTVPGGGAAEGDAASLTQKKTIRVKRPTMPAAAGAVADGTADAGPGAPSLFSEPTAQMAGPERGAGPFVAVAVLVVLAIVGLMIVISSQVFGPKAKIYIGGSDGPEITLPGAVNVGGG